MVEYAVVIRRQLREGGSRWQLWLGSGMKFEEVRFLEVMNHAGALGFEAVAAGHFDELAVPEVLLQRRLEPAPVAIDASPARSVPKRAATAAVKSSAKTAASKGLRSKSSAAKNG